MEETKLVSIMQKALKEIFKDSQFNVNENIPLMFDPKDLSPVIPIMEKTELGEQLRFSIKISDMLKK